MTRRLRLALAAIVMIVGSKSAHSVPSATPPAASCRAHAPEAAMRSGIAVDVILRVMRAESGGNPDIVSPKGAIGCMQIMPATWAYLSPRYGLESDPYDARMNTIGGSLYLAELARRFGWPGAYAAYNAGPARYIRYAANGVPLPAETVAYTARLGGAAAPAIPRSRVCAGKRRGCSSIATLEIARPEILTRPGRRPYRKKRECRRLRSLPRQVTT